MVLKILLVINSDSEERTVEVTRQLKARTLSKLDGKLSSTLSKIMCIMEEKDFEVQKLINNLCAADRNKITVFSTDEVFGKIQTYHMLSHQISKYCSIYDYELLEAFVESTNCQEAIEVLATFTDEMHSSILKELDLLSDCGQKLNPDDLMPGTYTFAIEYIGGHCTIEIKTIIQNVIREHFHLQKGTIIFNGVQKSSIIFVYQISAAVRLYLLQYQLENESLTCFAEHSITCLIIDGIKKGTLLQWNNEVYTCTLRQQYLLFTNLFIIIFMSKIIMI